MNRSDIAGFLIVLVIMAALAFLVVVAVARFLPDLIPVVGSMK